MEIGIDRYRWKYEGNRHMGNLHALVEGISILFHLPSLSFVGSHFSYVPSSWLKTKSKGCVKRFNFEELDNPVSVSVSISYWRSLR